MTDHLNEADEHERSERTGCQVTARKMPGASKDRAVRPRGHTSETEWSDRVVIQSLVGVLVGRSSDQRRQVRHPQELRPEWAVFFCSSLFIWYVALLVPGCGGEVASWTLVVANWAWAADVILRLRIPLSFSWTRFGCVFSRIFLTGGCLPSFSELETYFGLAHSSQLSRPVPGRLLGPRIFLHLTRTRNFSSSRQP